MEEILVCFTPESKPLELPVLWKVGDMEICVLEIYREELVLGPDFSYDLSQG